MTIAISCRSRSKASNSSSVMAGESPSNGSSSSSIAHVAGKRARDRDHLLLAAGQIVCGHAPAFGKPRKERDDAVIVPMNAGAGDAFEPAERQVVGHRHAGEQAAPLRHVSDAAPRDLGRGQLRPYSRPGA